MKWVGMVLFFSSLCIASSAPNFRAKTLSGKKVSLESLKEMKKPVLISFWASWCTPCLEELNEIKNGLAANPSLELTVLTVNVDTSETLNDVKPTIMKNSLNFEIILDPKHQIFSKFHVQKTLPFSVLINSQGEIVDSFNGFHTGMFENLKLKVEGLYKNAS